ncbi:hypothetical protein PR202_gb01301 [Eleusine coracana subsp. coracana]|uniref:Uncharacterized protein n=1 Tax=Eleusine coracana subsp. coracana TaxID=191504 RepID=A0AAV5DVJ9_ELECO|nr:hypothetical protein QOZ80_5BG0419860 [Eleusine coracana subsp. coracana]GJN14467.1 hypothetical protein PR202_gb01301 [Eleusine coracana subsp. coracana]
MSGFPGPRTRPWVGMAGADTPPQPDADAAALKGGGGADALATNASAISFGFAATAVLVSLFLLMAIFEHLIKPGLASSSHHDDEEESGEGSNGRGMPPVRRHPYDDDDDVSPDKLRHSLKVEEPVTGAADLPVLMPGQRYPTFLAQPAPLPPCPREGVWWPPHEHQQRHSFVPT